MLKTDDFFFLKRRCEDLRQSLIVHLTKRYKQRRLNKIKKIIVHASDRNWSILQLNEYDITGSLTYKERGSTYTDVNHISKTGLPAITYHACIDRLGKITQTLPPSEVSWHSAGYNTSSLAICLLYRVTNRETHKAHYGPSTIMMNSLVDLLAETCLQYGLLPTAIKGHRELLGTGFFIDKSGKQRLRKSCPGKKIDLNLLRSDVASVLQQHLSKEKFYTGTIDGKFGKKSKKAFKKFCKENT